MKKIAIALTCWAASSAMAQGVVGSWISIDDETRKPKSEVEIYQMGNKYFGKIINLFNIPIEANKVICRECKGEKKDKPLIGMNIIENMTKDGKDYKGGTITDPKSGKEYTCSFKLDEKDKNILILRGYIGPFYRSQYWKRKTVQ